MPFRGQYGPRLLISVRSCDEAACAIESGADILDVKEPTRGSLGMADATTIRQIESHSSFESRDIPLSIALGEMIEWLDKSAVECLPPRVTYAKLGLSGTRRLGEWQAKWCRIRAAFDEVRPSPLHWVAVIYADEVEADSPGAVEILDAAIETRCKGLLIDTYSKTRCGLTDFISFEQLKALAVRCHSAGLFFAVAGRLTSERLVQMGDVGADVIAIRSAACRNADRQAAIDSSSIRAFRHTMAQLFV